MNTADSNNRSTVKIDQIWRWMGIVVWIAVTFSLLGHYYDRLYSTSIDVGLHGTLVSRLMDSSDLPAVDEGLGEMATYPRLAHLLAARIGSELGSALGGMQYVGYISVILLWSSIGFGFLRLPSRRRNFAFLALAIFLWANREWFGLELFGSELVATYFFAHLVAQALALLLLVIAIGLESRRPESFNHLILLGLGGAFLTSVHLLPAVELIGTLGVLVLLSASVDPKEKRVMRFLAGSGIALFSLGLIVVNPDFIAMYRLSTNNGLMLLKYVHSVRDVAILAIGVALLSLCLIAIWWRKQKTSVNHEGLLLKYFGAFGLTLSGLCAIQVLLLVAFSKGSEYACFKYVTGLQSLLVLNAILFLVQLGRDRAMASDRGPSVFAPSALAALACFCVFPNNTFILTGAIISAEHEARLFAKSNGAPAPGTHDLAIGIAGIGGIGDFLISRLALGTPSLGNAYDILLGQFPKDAMRINRILSSSGSYPWDVSKCRRGAMGSLVILDGACVYGEFTSLKCADTIEFSSSGALDQAISGFSKPEANGRWSEGSVATLTCKTDGNSPHIAYLQSSGLVTESHTQRMIVSVNKGNPQIIEYSTSLPSQQVEISLPSDNPARLDFHFSFPDAVSPKELGMSDDARTLGILMFSIKFENN
ncbi:MAG: hypothetical protein ABIR27_10745 [Dokdonella sp.]